MKFFTLLLIVLLPIFALSSDEKPSLITTQYFDGISVQYSFEAGNADSHSFFTYGYKLTRKKLITEKTYFTYSLKNNSTKINFKDISASLSNQNLDPNK
ncbi:MAG: hypothetical protein HRU38_22150 [Saccharospirillaceae bacterium]|nr:hypothetical protein [Pseudomonadales bacterium]NRB81332.1 hypothetical protein [Saccharospirillaceae bacterium]